MEKERRRHHEPAYHTDLNPQEDVPAKGVRGAWEVAREIVRDVLPYQLQRQFPRALGALQNLVCLRVEARDRELVEAIAVDVERGDLMPEAWRRWGGLGLRRPPPDPAEVRKFIASVIRSRFGSERAAQ